MPKFIHQGALTEQERLQWLKDLYQHAYCPLSGFNALVLVRSRLPDQTPVYFAGVNIESYDTRVASHGEEGAFGTMMTALGPQTRIEQMSCLGVPQDVSNPDDPEDQRMQVFIRPCGKCAQQLSNLADPEMPIESFIWSGQKQETTLGQVLPNAFNYDGFAPEAKQSSHAKARPAPLDIIKQLYRKDAQSDEDIFKWLQSLSGLVPNSRLNHAIVLQCQNNKGDVFHTAGVRIEEAAYITAEAVQTAINIARIKHKDFSVQAIYSMTTPLEGTKSDQFWPLGGASAQFVSEFADDNCPIHLMHNKDEVLTYTLAQSSALMPRFADDALTKQQALAKLTQ